MRIVQTTLPWTIQNGSGIQWLRNAEDHDDMPALEATLASAYLVEASTRCWLGHR